MDDRTGIKSPDTTATGVVETHVNAFVQDPFVRLVSPPAVTVKITMRRP